MIELDKIYNEDCLIGMQRIPDGTEMRYRNHQRNKRGKLESVECYFVEHRNIIQEIK